MTWKESIRAVASLSDTDVRVHLDLLAFRQAHPKLWAGLRNHVCGTREPASWKRRGAQGGAPGLPTATIVEVRLRAARDRGAA